MKVWDAIDAEFLRSARQARALDHVQLAARATVSVAQLTQLEDGGDSSFYSPAIKLATGRHVLRKLGLDLPDREPPPAEAVAAAAPSLAPSLELTSAAPPVAPLIAIDTGRHRSWPVLTGSVALACALMTAGWWASRPAPATGPAVDRWMAAGVQMLGAMPTGIPAVMPSMSPMATPTTATTVPVAHALDTSPVPHAEPVQTLVVQPSADGAACAWTPQPARIDAVSRGKPDTYVHLRAERDAAICVMDGQQRVARLQLKAGEERSVHGSGPWQISGDQLEHVNVFFRGTRVRAPEATAPSHWLLVSRDALPDAGAASRGG